MTIISNNNARISLNGRGRMLNFTFGGEAYRHGDAAHLREKLFTLVICFEKRDDGRRKASIKPIDCPFNLTCGRRWDQPKFRNGIKTELRLLDMVDGVWELPFGNTGATLKMRIEDDVLIVEHDAPQMAMAA